MKIEAINVHNKEVKLSSLNVIVGANGVGKTTLLNELYDTLTLNKNQNKLKWTNLLPDDYIKIERTDWVDWLQSLEIISGQNHRIGNQQYGSLADPRTIGKQNKPRMLNEEYKAEVQRIIESQTSPKFADYMCVDECLRQQRASLLRVDDRLFLSTSNIGQFSNDLMNSIQPAPFLASHPEILKSINQKMAAIFGKKIFTESCRNFEYELYTCKKSNAGPKHFEYSPQNIKKIAKAINDWCDNCGAIKLSEEGHGIRAAAQILYELENDANEILFIDEPELHLYPSAKYELGAIIGKYSKRRKKQILISTHDSDLLRGLIESRANPTIIRIMENHDVKSIMGKDIKSGTQNNVLESVFSNAAIIVEGVQDQYVYNNVISFKKFLGASTCQIISSNGKENIGNDFYLFENLGIKFAAVMDYDCLHNVGKKPAAIKKCLNNLKHLDPEDKNNLLTKISSINDFSINATNKKQGIRCPDLNEEQIEIIKALLDDLASFGLFVCPIGELENWVNMDKGAEATPEIIFSKYKSRCNSKYKNLTDFMLQVCKYLQS